MRITTAILSALAAFLVSAFQPFSLSAFAEEVTPASCIVSNLRDVADSALYASDVTFYQGDYITFTNSVMFTDATATTPQNLSNCTINVTLGNSTVSNTATGYIVNATGGVWGAEVIVPAADPCYIEVGVSNVFNYTYPREKIRTRTKLP
jgi:hypothetical protein